MIEGLQLFHNPVDILVLGAVSHPLVNIIQLL